MVVGPMEDNSWNRYLSLGPHKVPLKSLKSKREKEREKNRKEMGKGTDGREHKT